MAALPASLSLRTRRTGVLAMLGALAVTAGVLAPVTTAEADTRPIDPTQPATVSADPLPTAQINGVVWEQVIVGDRVFNGGNFTAASGPGTAADVPRRGIMSFRLSTGALDSFAPTMNGQVRTVAVSPDQTILYIGGDFTQVNGVTRNRIAAFDIASGQLTSFAPSASSTVRAIATLGSTVYVGGDFSTFGGSGRAKAAAVTSSGSLLPWSPQAAGTGQVTSLAVSPDGSKVAIGGNFTALNGGTTPGYGLAYISSTGDGRTNLPMAANTRIRNAGTNGSITALVSNGTDLFVSGYDFGNGANFEGSARISWATGDIIWVDACLGDTYSVWANDQLEYKASHAHNCSFVANGFPEQNPRTWRHSLAYTMDVKGTVNGGEFNGLPAPEQADFYPVWGVGDFTGQGQATWSVVGTDQYVVFGGEFHYVNGKRQEGLVRFAIPSIAPNDVGPQVSGDAWVPTGTSRASGEVTVSIAGNFDHDNERLTYRLLRNGTVVSTTTAESRWFRRGTVTLTDGSASPGSSGSYTVQAVDPFGNSATSAAVSVTAGSGSAQTAYAREVLGDSPKHYWRLDGTGTTSGDIATGATLTAQTAVTRGVAGAIDGDSSTAWRFSGSSSSWARTTAAETGPQSFTVSGWYKTTSNAGGKIIGFGNSSSGASSAVDRHLYLDASGRLNFGVFNGSNQVITSPGATNNGQWHFAAATLSTDGMKLYLDGALVAQRANVWQARAGSGYWRVGGDTSWSGSGYLAGDIDEPAVYTSALTAAQIGAQWTVGGGGTTPPPPTNQAPTASFTASTSLLVASVNGNGSSDADGTIASYAWNWGDGTTGSGATTTHSYTADGTYTITLTVTDDDGATASTNRQVTVAGPVTPPPAGVLAADSFARTVANGWGTATTGGPWTVSGTASAYNVNGSAGTMTAAAAGATFTARLNGISSTTSDTTVSVSTQQAIEGASAYATIIGRVAGGSDYRGRVIFGSTAGKVNVELQRGGTTLVAANVAGLAYTPGQQLRVRVQVEGTGTTTLRIKVWAAGTPEPGSWYLTTTDTTAALQAAGPVGLSYYLGGSSTGLPRTFAFDDLTVNSIG